MSGIEDPDTPPEVPEEFAAAYRDAYRRALTQDQAQDPTQEPAQDSAQDSGPAAGPSPSLLDELTTPVMVPGPGASEAGPAWQMPAMIGAAALLVIAAAFGLGRLVSSGDQTGRPPVVPATVVPPVSATTPTQPGQPHGRPSRPADTTDPAIPVGITGAATGCTSAPAVDSAGHRVTYQVANVFDGRDDTAWRCDGTAIGTRLVLTIPAGTLVDEVGLIPGYAKTDPKSGTDRYAENNRITKVRWTLANGVVVVQDLNPSPTDRAVQRIRTPRTATGRITLEILAVARGPRNTTAISEIVVGAAPS